MFALGVVATLTVAVAVALLIGLLAASSSDNEEIQAICGLTLLALFLIALGVGVMHSIGFHQ